MDSSIMVRATAITNDDLVLTIESFLLIILLLDEPQPTSLSPLFYYLLCPFT